MRPLEEVLQQIQAMRNGPSLTGIALLFGLALAACSLGEEGSAATSSGGGQRAPGAGAERFYRQLLAQHGENYNSCLQEVEPVLAPGRPSPLRSPPPARRDLNVVVAFDSSGSMAGKVVEGAKIEVAKTAVERFLGSLPLGARVGLVVYGHRGSNQPAGQAVSCAGVEERYALDELDPARLAQGVRSFQPTGYTPLAAAIRKAGDALAGHAGETNENVVYVVSDGLETCGGDPVAAARDLHESNAKAIVNIIGFDVVNADQRQLRAVAQAGGGQFFSAGSGVDLNRAFTDSLNILRESRYRAENAVAQSRTAADYGVAMSKFTACIGVKLSREQARLGIALSKLSSEDPNYRYQDYVREQTEQRRSRVETFKRQIDAALSQQREIGLDRLRQDLKALDQEFSAHP
jgi:Ca-activated chloride channel homolog